jgi:hypothetical protein
MPSEPTVETLLARSIVQLAGRDPAHFSARLSGHSVHVLGPSSAARYPKEGWLELFRAHLQAGFFDQPRGPVTGGTG